MSRLRNAVQEYLQLRRNLGYKLLTAGVDLQNFVTFAEHAKASHITTDLALQWAQKPRNAQPARWARRLGVIRCFAIWLSATDPRTEIPPAGLLPRRDARRRPYIYSDVEITKLIRTASKLRSPAGLKGHTYSTILGLLAVTGMRISEALALDRDDVDLSEGILRIRRTKFGKSRLVPIHKSTCRVLAEYARVRDCIIHRPAVVAFFVSERGQRLKPAHLNDSFATVSRKVGLRPPKTGRRPRRGHGPRIHDMRHRFAVCTLIHWYRTGVDVERELPKLATYLGHAHVNSTYWYIEAVPELLQLATRRLENERRRSHA